jgi:LPS O-antigen subunit length determinant protein (WzzB/FepE family)
MKQDKVLGLALLLTLAAPLALALAQETWTPQINVSPVRDFLVQVLKWTTYVAVLFIITYVVLKVLYGRALARLFELAEFDLYMDTFGVGSG